MIVIHTASLLPSGLPVGVYAAELAAGAHIKLLNGTIEPPVKGGGAQAYIEGKGLLEALKALKTPGQEITVFTLPTVAAKMLEGAAQETCDGDPLWAELLAAALPHKVEWFSRDMRPITSLIKQMAVDIEPVLAAHLEKLLCSAFEFKLKDQENWLTVISADPLGQTATELRTQFGAERLEGVRAKTYPQFVVR